MEIVLLVSALAILFIVIALAEPVADRLRLPYSVVLAVLGATLGAASVGLSTTYGDQLSTEVQALLALPISRVLNERSAVSFRAWAKLARYNRSRSRRRSRSEAHSAQREFHRRKPAPRSRSMGT